MKSNFLAIAVSLILAYIARPSRVARMPLDKALMRELSEVAKRLAAPGRGLLAADESTSTIGKRFEKAGLKNEEVCEKRCTAGTAKGAAAQELPWVSPPVPVLYMMHAPDRECRSGRLRAEWDRVMVGPVHG